MKRNVSLEEISDGKLYSDNDMVKAGCNDCKGCHDCCKGMGDSIVLDPLDVYRLSAHLGQSFEQLLTEHLELGVVDGMILPHLKMAGAEEKCTFLNEEGRCSIHPHRPGICRLFPLGRFYEDGSYRYFLQTKECTRVNRTKVKVGKWIDTPDANRYKEFVTRWHYFLNDCEEAVTQSQDEEFKKQLNLFVLQLFYMKPFDREQDFYVQFGKRMETAREVI